MSRPMYRTWDGEAYALPEPAPADQGTDPIAVVDLARRAAGITPDQLADRSGLNPKTVSAILNGSCGATPDQMRRMCAALSIDMPPSHLWLGR